MKQLKQIIIDRIANILELQRAFKTKSEYQDNKYDYIVELKKIERLRSLRQNDILMSMSNLSSSISLTQQEIFNQTVQICGLYDPTFLKYRTDSEEFSLKKLYVEFFNTHGFQDKSIYISSLFDKEKTIGLSPALFFGWLSEWSKKIYCDTLQKEIEKSFTNKEKSPKSLNNSITLGLLQSKSKKLEKCLAQNNSSQLSEISLANRPNIQSFFLEDLQAYYKLTGIAGVDTGYLKTIRKRLHKEELLKPHNLSRAVATLVDSPANKQISNIMKAYQVEYSAKFQKQPKQISNSKTYSNQAKILPFCPVKRRPRIITESEESTNINQNKFFSPKLSQLEFNPEDQQNKFRRIKIVSHFKSIRNNLEFRGLTFKKDAKFIQIVPDRNFFKLSKNRQEVIASLQNRLKQKDFLKCESILSKYRLRDDPDLFSSKVYSSELCSPMKDKKLEILSSDYDDHKLKIAKMFELTDLRINNKYSSKSKSFVQQAY